MDELTIDELERLTVLRKRIDSCREWLEIEIIKLEDKNITPPSIPIMYNITKKGKPIC